MSHQGSVYSSNTLKDKALALTQYMTGVDKVLGNYTYNLFYIIKSRTIKPICTQMLLS